MNKIESYKQSVAESYQISAPLLLENSLQQITSEKKSILSALNESGSIKIPIVGDFSAGKSSLLNEFIGNETLLPVDITPETAVAYELYFDYNERAELYRNGAKIQECNLNEIKQLNTQPGDIAKVYIHSSKIKDLEQRGITLVDMPGIDSGIKEHNDAILNYINKGTVFVLCVDCGAGSLRQSTMAFLEELSKYNLRPAVIVTKTDKKPKNEVAEIVEYIAFQAKKSVGSATYVGTASAHNHDIAGFENFLKDIDTAKLLEEKFSSRIAQFLGQQINALKTQASVYSANIEDVQKQLETLEKEKLEAATEINDAKVGDTPEKSTQDVLDLVTIALKGRSAEIAQMVIDKEDATSINARILNYIRPVIIMAFREEGEQYAAAMNTVVDKVSVALQDNMKVDGNIFDNLIEDFREDIVGGLSIAANLLIAMPNIFAKALGWVLKFLGDKVPDLLRWFLGKSKESMLADVITKIENEVIPQIVERLRPEILQQITAQQQRIRDNVRDQVVSSIGNVQDSVMASGEVADKAELENRVKLINTAIEKISNMKNSL